MATSDDVLRVARGELGYTMWSGETGTKYGRWYAKMTGSPYFGGNGVPWCAMFVSWVLDRAGVRCQGFPRAVAIDMRDAGARPAREARPGDAIGFDWEGDRGGDHVGIVESVHDWGCVTIEGNTDGGVVARKQRPWATMTCVIRPDYGPSRLAVDGDVGPATVAAWQRALGTTDDGVVSGQPAWAAKWVPALSSYDRGEGGSLMVKALQRTLKGAGPVDGVLGYHTVYALQLLLFSWGYLLRGGADHYLGISTAKALQRSLNDGRWGR